MVASYKRAHRDLVHPGIVKELRQCGYSVFETHHIGGGFPDLVVGYGGITTLVELKTPRALQRGAALEQSQKDFIRDWRGATPLVAESTEQIIAHFKGRIHGSNH